MLRYLMRKIYGTKKLRSYGDIPTISISADELVHKFETNELAAKELFLKGDKKIIIHGQATRVSDSIKGPCLWLNLNNDKHLKCYFKAYEKNNLISLNLPATITLTGVIKYDRWVFGVWMENCEFVSRDQKANPQEQK